MPNFKQMHQFVEYVYKYNTKDYEEDEATLNNLVDENYQVQKGIKKDDALRKFNDKFKLSNPEVAEICHNVEKLGFIKTVTSEDNPHAQGIVLIVEFAGKEFIHKSRRLRLKTGKWEAWLNYHDKKVVLAAGVAGGGLLGNMEYVVEIFRRLF